jgi:hypothetical protein
MEDMLRRLVGAGMRSADRRHRAPALGRRGSVACRRS